ncbi:MAG: hypothetical protein M3R08_05595 [Bacteroidota bacterium]|nr:hypothetical protein [Bacteroidota bacterium]
MLTAARWISILLHPVFMPLYTIALVMWMDPDLVYFLPDQARYIMLTMIFVMTVAFPLTSTLLLLRAHLLTSLEMRTSQERIAPFGMTLLYYCMTYYLLRQSPLHPVVLSIFAGVIVAMLLTLLITLRWKISAHMVGVGGMLGAITAVTVVHSLAVFPIIALVIVIAGLLGTARSIAGTHMPAQIYSGVALGFAAIYFCVFWEVAV